MDGAAGRRGDGVVVLGAAAYLAVNLFRGLRAPFLLGGDQVFFWMEAQRMLFGERIYHDFFQYTPPGTDLVYLGLFKVFGPQVWVTDAVVLALGVALCWVCFSITREAMDRSFSLLAAALFLVVIYGKLLSGTHHFFSLLAVLGAVQVLMKGPTEPRCLGAGALAGVASFFTQTHGVIALMAMMAAAAWESRRAGRVRRWHGASLLGAGFLAASLLLSAHLIATEGLREVWTFQVMHVWEHLVRGVDGGFTGFAAELRQGTLLQSLRYLGVCVLLPIVYGGVLWRLWKGRSGLQKWWVVLLWLVGLSLLLEVSLSPNSVRVYAVSMPGIILLVWLAGKSRGLRRPGLAMGWVGVVCLAMTQTVGRYRTQTAVIRLPGGMVALDKASAAKFAWIAQHSAPGAYFLQAEWPGIYLPLGLRNPAYVDDIEDAYRTPEDIAPTAGLLEKKRVEYILWSKRLDFPQQRNHGTGDSFQAFRIYVHSRYAPVKVFADGDTLLQKDDCGMQGVEYGLCSHSCGGVK